MQNQIEKPYQTNSYIGLKRDAVVNGDLDMLRGVKRFEEVVPRIKRYYVHQRETIIRDREGNEIDRRILPFDQDEASLHFRTLLMGKAVSMMEDKPGDLVAEIKFVQKLRRSSMAEIFEVPDAMEFPLPEDFQWMAFAASLPEDYDFESDTERLNIYSWHTKATT